MSAPTRSTSATMCGTRPGSWRSTGSRSGVGDHLPLGGLISRIRTLDADGLQTLLTYEQAHANRAPVVTAMQNRLSSLREGAQPSGGDPAADVTAEAPEHAAGGSKASEATAGP